MFGGSLYLPQKENMDGGNADMTERTQKLKPCPFCGSSHVEAFCQYEEDCPDRSVIVRCHSCDAQSAQMIGRGKIDMAIAAWNRRAPQCEKE